MPGFHRLVDSTLELAKQAGNLRAEGRRDGTRSASSPEWPDEPDGRPLHAYDIGDEDRAALQALLRDALRRGAHGGGVPAAFVLWAADRIRTTYRGGLFKWQFVFDGLGCPADQAVASDLVARGLRWWHRKVHRSNAGRSFYLYSLLAEGGIPDHLLEQESQYRRAITGLMTEIEAMRALEDEDVWVGLAARWTEGLPQTFQNGEFVRLLAFLAGRIARLRATIPGEVPVEAAVAWLDANDAGWMAELPLRPSSSAAQALVRGIVQAERGTEAIPGGVIAGRELFRDEEGNWSGWLRLEERGQLSSALLPGALGLRLRMLPTGQATAVPYAATPSDRGWDLRRLGGRPGPAHLAFEPRRAFGLAAYADGIAQGEIEILPGLHLEDEGYALWRMLKDGEDGEAGTVRLEQLPGAAQVRQTAIWVLAPHGAPVSAGDGLLISGPEPCEGDHLWRVEGRGELRVGEDRIAVRTGADEDAPQARLTAVGPILSGWRTIDRELVVLGEPRFVGERDGGLSRTLAPRNLLFTQAAAGGRASGSASGPTGARSWRGCGLSRSRSVFALRFPSARRAR